MRGKGTVRGKSTRPWRITPAYAGKSVQRSVDNAFKWDHPRLCGEKYLIPKYVCVVTGSPPPMRGKAKNTSPRFNCDRITPAYAGKSGAS